MSFAFTYPYPSPESKGWGPGWPDCQRDKVVPHPLFVGGVHEDILELVNRLVAECELRGFEFVAPGCWGFGCRAKKRSDGSLSDEPSVHSWALSLDINAPRNVFGAAKEDSEIATKFEWLPELFREYGFFWLGPSIHDWMHFHFAGTPTDAKAVLEKARKDGLGEDRMTDAEQTAFKELESRVRDLELRDEGMTRRLHGLPEPEKLGPKRSGWRRANKFLTEPVA